MSDGSIVVTRVIKIFFFIVLCISCHLFLISSASLRSITFLSFFVANFAWNVPLVSLIFLKRSPIFRILLFSSISLYCSLKKAFLSLLVILWYFAFRWVYLSFSSLSSAFLFFSQLFARPSQTTVLYFCIYFSWGWFWSLPSVQCYEPPPIVLQALCLSDLPLDLFVTSTV